MEKFFAHINNSGIVDAVIPEFDPQFPKVPINLRYSSDFIGDCIQITDTNIKKGYIYDRDLGEFKSPVETDINSNDKLDEAIEKKISELSSDCSEAIISGFDFNNEHYSFNLDDQSNIQGSKILADAGIPVPYHPDGGDCREYDPNEFLALIMTATIHKESHLTYFNQLKQYIKTLTDIDSIKSITYGVELTGSYLEKYNSIINNLKQNLNAAMNNN